MTTKIQFNPLTGNPITGRNLEKCLEASKERKYRSNKWITFRQAINIGLSVKGLHGVRCVGYPEENGKTKQVSWTSFNLDEFQNQKVPAKLTNAKPPKAQKAAPKATKSRKPEPNTEPTNAEVMATMQQILALLGQKQAA